MSDHAAAIRGLRRWHPNPLVQDTINRIRAHGWAVTAISEQCSCPSDECHPPDCSFAYTSGMGLHSIPELAVYGLDAWTSRELLNELGDIFHTYDWRDAVDRGVEIMVSSLDVPVRVIEMIDKDDLVVTGELFPDAPALQAVWADDFGKYPWDEGYALTELDQKLTGVAGTGADRVRAQRVINRGAGPNRAQRRAALRRR
ncbi:DUF4262 domain-containing protein [Gordonia hankookensis]|uniref:DUF4262 domain-containing protein n=1 Tax=Gordonia hankookensis TaxID=589403 RepID=A0ABR7W7F9_9ACTN|nr:DUF4262 domain-containing protein [Gordonia hankookensis]MBD1318761.1 DUF4262 domain-containing protein [Gordonia hankookensis]NDZ94281.1 DUF4262 domain-containing protein [Streptomyces sp. SID11726]NEB25069.1 DUF4262 domain-containing protein [Streptomyces sp. SID6673]